MTKPNVLKNLSKSYREFESAATKVQTMQEQLLLSIVRRNHDTLFGRRHGFAKIRAIADFQQQVPVMRYEDYAPYIGAMMRGQQKVLVSERVLLFELSSGSTAASKLIPYTAALKAEFQRAISAWLFDIYSNQPSILSGKSYWCITPMVRHRKRTRGGTPIGFEEDTQYLGENSGILKSSLAVPSEVKDIGTWESFRYVTLLFLLRCKDLSAMSVWSPTFLLLLFGPLQQVAVQIADDIESGAISRSGLSNRLRRKLNRHLKRDPERAAELRAIFRAGGSAAQVFPNLKLISCWSDGPSASYMPQVSALFPQAQLQGKGIIATEGIVSFPLLGLKAPVLAIASHFFEFIDSAGTVVLAHQLRSGKQYSVIITTSGGLYRYRLHDVIEVVGFEKQLPMLRFVSKEDFVSDVCGEKINAFHITKILRKLCVRYRLRPNFSMLAPEKSDSGLYYVLYTECFAAKARLKAFRDEFERELRKNYNYNYCRQLEQLQKLRLFLVSERGNEVYVKEMVSRGMRLGSIKPSVLDKAMGWPLKFRGEFV